MEFTVDGEPQGKARPRFSRVSGCAYTPAKTTAYENKIKAAFLVAGGRRIPAGHYVRVAVEAYFGVPKYYSKKRRLACRENAELPAKKPDADNILKAVLDALNGLAYEDDKQVVSLTCKKKYAPDGEGSIKVGVYEEKK